jgi:hypothetical protein
VRSGGKENDHVKAKRKENPMGEGILTAVVNGTVNLSNDSDEERLEKEAISIEGYPENEREQKEERVSENEKTEQDITGPGGVWEGTEAANGDAKTLRLSEDPPDDEGAQKVRNELNSPHDDEATGDISASGSRTADAIHVEEHDSRSDQGPQALQPSQPPAWRLLPGTWRRRSRSLSTR